jgi:hypothetical protein
MPAARGQEQPGGVGNLILWPFAGGIEGKGRTLWTEVEHGSWPGLSFRG